MEAQALLPEPREQIVWHISNLFKVKGSNHKHGHKLHLFPTHDVYVFVCWYLTLLLSRSQGDCDSAKQNSNHICKKASGRSLTNGFTHGYHGALLCLNRPYCWWRQVWRRQYMSKALWKVILIPPDQRCLVFVYFENLWEVNTPPCSEAQTDYWCLVSSWIKAMSTHSVSPAYITEPPPLTPSTPFVSYLRHRHKVG